MTRARALPENVLARVAAGLVERGVRRLVVAGGRDFFTAAFAAG